jgi:hypothetical protein
MSKYTEKYIGCKLNLHNFNLFSNIGSLNDHEKIQYFVNYKKKLKI